MSPEVVIASSLVHRHSSSVAARHAEGAALMQVQLAGCCILPVTAGRLAANTRYLLHRFVWSGRVQRCADSQERS